MAAIHWILVTPGSINSAISKSSSAISHCRVLSNFAFSFSIISVLTGITTLYNTGLSYGGPLAMTYGWFVAGFFTMMAGLSMAEICSFYPTSGGLYYWSASLSGNYWAPFASWMTGWMAYAFSRDGAMPFSSFWHKVSQQVVPINAVWLSVLVSFCMALTSLGSLVAFQAMVSIATIALYIAYAFPIFFRIILARKSFVPGPLNLGLYGILVGWVALGHNHHSSLLSTCDLPNHEGHSQLHLLLLVACCCSPFYHGF